MLVVISSFGRYWDNTYRHLVSLHLLNVLKIKGMYKPDVKKSASV
jgi:hypothetical protein